MASIKEIAIQTFKNLNDKNIDPTPKNYTQEFCNVNSTSDDCEFFTNSMLSLSQEELDHYKTDKIKSIYDIINILLKRPTSSALSEQTGEVGNIIKNMDSQIQESIKSHYVAFMNIKNIKKDIQESDTNAEIKIVKTKLINATSSLENEIEAVNKKLTNEKEQIVLLEEKIKTLEDNLDTYKKESTIDFLTSLLTRKAYEKEVEKYEERYKRDGRDYAVVFFDLDKFKAVNDNYGHDCGDTVLKTFGLILNKLTRKTDVVARYGGEEFVALIEYSEEKDLVKYLKRVKDVVTSNKFTHKDLKLDITFSAGVDLRSLHNSYEDTIQQADILLYEAKFDGRNKIIISSGTHL